MPIKMVMETEDKRVHMNITANQCPGCPENLATRLVMQTVFDHLKDEDPIVFGQGCGIGRDFLQRSGLGTHDSGIVGMLTAMEIRGIDRPIVVIDGDGQVDLGLEDLATAFQQGYKYLHVVCDNQAHAASGSHATGSTHPLAPHRRAPFGQAAPPETLPADAHVQRRRVRGDGLHFPSARPGPEAEECDEPVARLHPDSYPMQSVLGLRRR